MTSLQQRQNLIESVAEAMAAGARQDQACAVLGLSPRTLQRWQAGDDEPVKPVCINSCDATDFVVE